MVGALFMFCLLTWAGQGQTIRWPSLLGGLMSAPGGTWRLSRGCEQIDRPVDLCSQLLLLVPCRPWQLSAHAGLVAVM